MKALSITQALEQGFEYCGYSIQGFLKLIYIEELESHQVTDNLLLAKKDIPHPTGMVRNDDLTDIKLILGEDRTYCDRCDQTVTFDDVVDYNEDQSFWVCERCSQDLNEAQFSER